MFILSFDTYVSYGLGTAAEAETRPQGAHDARKRALRSQYLYSCVFSISTVVCTQLAEVTSIPAVKTMSRNWKAAAISEIGGRREERQSLKGLPGASPCSRSGLDSGVRVEEEQWRKRFIQEVYLSAFCLRGSRCSQTLFDKKSKTRNLMTR